MTAHQTQRAATAEGEKKHCWPYLDWIYRKAESNHCWTWWIIVMATSMASLSCLNGNTFQLEGGDLATRCRGGKWCVWGVNKDGLTLCWRAAGALATHSLVRYCYWLSFIMCINVLPLKDIIIPGWATASIQSHTHTLVYTLLVFSNSNHDDMHWFIDNMLIC